MKTVDLDQIEREFGSRLPLAYRSLWERDWVPAEGFETYLLEDPAALIGINHELRHGEFAQEWRRGWFVVGTGAAGDVIFIDTASEAPSVLVWDHETHEVRVVAPSLAAFAASLASGDELEV